MGLDHLHRQRCARHPAEPALPGADRHRLVGTRLGAAGDHAAGHQHEPGGRRLPGIEPGHPAGGALRRLRQGDRQAAGGDFRGDAGRHPVSFRHRPVRVGEGSALAGAGDVRHLPAVQAGHAALRRDGGAGGGRRDGGRQRRAAQRSAGARACQAGMDHPRVQLAGDPGRGLSAGDGGADRAVRARHGRAAQCRLPDTGKPADQRQCTGHLVARTLRLPRPEPRRDHRGDLHREGIP